MTKRYAVSCNGHFLRLAGKVVLYDKRRALKRAAELEKRWCAVFYWYTCRVVDATTGEQVIA